LGPIGPGGVPSSKKFRREGKFPLAGPPVFAKNAQRTGRDVPNGRYWPPWTSIMTNGLDYVITRTGPSPVLYPVAKTIMGRSFRVQVRLPDTGLGSRLTELRFLITTKRRLGRNLVAVRARPKRARGEVRAISAIWGPDGFQGCPRLIVGPRQNRLWKNPRGGSSPLATTHGDGANRCCSSTQNRTGPAVAAAQLRVGKQETNKWACALRSRASTTNKSRDRAPKVEVLSRGAKPSESFEILRFFRIPRAEFERTLVVGASGAKRKAGRRRGACCGRPAC